MGYRGGEREKEIKMYLRNYAENLLNLNKETYPGTGRAECPRHNESKQTNNKTYHN